MHFIKSFLNARKSAFNWVVLSSWRVEGGPGFGYVKGTLGVGGAGAGPPRSIAAF
jgi:uncharacterized membrane protein